MSTRVLSLRVLRAGAADIDRLDATDPIDPRDAQRPRTRGECGEERPCPWVGCKHNLYLDVLPETGSLKLNFPELGPEEMRDSCAIDVAERGTSTLEAVGEVMNLTRERVRQVEVRGLLKLKSICRMES